MTIGFNHLGQLGQLGNQMFQYAITKSVASKLNVPFKIPNHQNVFDDGIGNRYTILLFDIFKLESLNDFSSQNYLESVFPEKDIVILVRLSVNPIPPC